MKKLVYALFILFGGVQYAHAQASTANVATPTKVEQELLDLSRKKWLWMADKNVDSLALLFDPKAMFVHMGGSWGTTQELNIIKSGGIHYKKAEVYSASVKIIDNTAILLNDIDLIAALGNNEVDQSFHGNRSIHQKKWQVDYGFSHIF